jgi:hypothetical protein
MSTDSGIVEQLSALLVAYDVGDMAALRLRLDEHVRLRAALTTIADYDKALMFTSLAPAQAMRALARDALGRLPARQAKAPSPVSLRAKRRSLTGG